MLVFGGFSADKIVRYFNDLWYFNTEEEVWSQPPAGGDKLCRGQHRTNAQDALARRAHAARRPRHLFSEHIVVPAWGLWRWWLRAKRLRRPPLR